MLGEHRLGTLLVSRSFHVFERRNPRKEIRFRQASSLVETASQSSARQDDRLQNGKKTPYPSIHPPLIRDLVAVAAGEARYSKGPSPRRHFPALPAKSWGVPIPNGIFNSIHNLQWVLHLPQGLLPEDSHSWSDPLRYFHMKQRSSNSSPSSSPYLKGWVQPTYKANSFSVSCIHDLILLVTSQSL